MWTEIETTPWDESDPAAVRAHRVLHALRRFEAAEAAMRARSARAMNVTENDLQALRYVIRRQRAGEYVTPTDVAQHLQTKSAAVTIMVDHLERAGHLVRLPHPKDRRSLVLEATPEAIERIDDIYGGVSDTAIGVAERFDEGAAGRVVAFLDDLSDALDHFVADSATVPQRQFTEARTEPRDASRSDDGDAGKAGTGHALAS
ncbi:MarR family winged helix-turn-helix transcriptional regulator [Microbacterium sp. GXF7504]